MITKCFWLSNLFLRGTDLSKSNLIVVFIFILWSGSLIIADLFKIQKLAPACRSNVSEYWADSMCDLYWLSQGSVGPECAFYFCFVLLFWLQKELLLIARNVENNEKCKEKNQNGS